MKGEKIKHKRILKFPDGFLWGAATSAYQVEGGIDNNDWATSKMPPAGRSGDHYHRFQEDFGLAKKLHQNAHRLSLEWSRIEPEEGNWNEDELEHYVRVLSFLKSRGFKTFVTLHHFTNPVWVARQGGWAKKEIVDHFVGYVGKVAEKLGHYIDFWVTINEPNVYTYLCFLQATWPPYEKSLWKAYKVYRNMLLAHNRAYDMIHAYYPRARVGFAQNVPANEPYDKGSFFDEALARFSDWLNIQYPLSRTKNDFFGVNYYFRNVLKFWSFRRHRRTKKLPLTDKGWEIYPKGLFEVLMKLRKLKKPIYITENGIADAADAKRAKFIVDHLEAVHKAIEKGADVRGYFYWSLLDNYEWPARPPEKTGYEMKFGLLQVDFDNPNLPRSVRKSAEIYAQICKNNGITL